MPSDSPAAPKRQRGCPLCGKPPVPDYRPFCSRGCRDRDLNAWFGEGYRLPIAPEAEGDDLSGE